MAGSKSQHEMPPDYIPLQENRPFKNGNGDDDDAPFTSTTVTAVTNPVVFSEHHASSHEGAWAEIFFDCVIILAIMIFLIEAILALAANGKYLNQYKWISELVASSKYGPTIFPVLFAAGAGSFAKAVASYKLERGTTVTTMEQLLGSHTIVSAIWTQMQLKAFNFLALGLVVLWLLSPIGSQASLRVVRTELFPNVTLANLSYMDFNNWQMGAYSPNDFGYSLTRANAIFTTALAAGQKVKLSAQDPWGNVKIPMLESNVNASVGSWTPIVQADSTKFAALVGIPATNLDTIGNATFLVETAYWDVECSDMTFSSGPNNDTKIAWQANNGLGFRMRTNNTLRPTPANPLKLAVTPRQLWYEAKTGNLSSQFYAMTACTLSTIYVEVNVSCTASDGCSASQVRPSLKPHNDSAFSVLDTVGIEKDTALFKNFVNATTSSASSLIGSAGSPTESYFEDPLEPYSLYTRWPNYRNISTADFSMRLSQLLNTYWLCGIAAGAVNSGLQDAINAPQVGDATARVGKDNFQIFNTTAQQTTLHVRLVASIPWAITLFVASGALLACSVTAIIFTLSKHGPDTLENFSTLVRHSRFVDPTHTKGSSALGGFEHARRMKDLKVQMGDVAPDGDVGHIAIATPETVPMGRLRKGRWYA